MDGEALNTALASRAAHPTVELLIEKGAKVDEEALNIALDNQAPCGMVKMLLGIETAEVSDVSVGPDYNATKRLRQIEVMK